MKNLHTFAVASLITLASAGVSFADSGICTNLSRTLSVGSSGSDVLQLQTFLVTQNYPGSGSWMLTGHFGKATEAAVRIFQSQQNLSQTGVADDATRSAINSVSCGSAVATTPVPGPSSNNQWAPQWTPWNANSNSSPYNYNYSYNSYPYPYSNSNNSYTNYVNLNLTSLSQNTGFPGQSVTIYGTGFDPVGNTINFSGQTVTGVSSNGTSITFTVPSYYYYAGFNYNGTPVSITVSNSRGTSNAMTFTVYGGYQPCQYLYLPWYNGTNPCQVNLPTNNYNAPTISYIDPTSGGVGQTITVFGTGFTQSNNTVHFGVGIITGLLSPDGRSVSFAVPSQLSGYGAQNVGLGAYAVSVTNSYGYTTNAATFTITSLSSSGTNVSIASVNGPATVSAGNSSTWTVVLNNPTGANATVSVNWGDSTVYAPYAAQSQTVYSGTQTFTFTHSYSNPGTYSATFTATGNSGVSNTATASVVVTGYNGGTTNGSPYISSMVPTYGSVGTQVTVYGSNFSQWGNTVRFGNGAINNASSNGTSITFAIPSYMNAPCYYSQPACLMPAWQVTPGTYQVFVINANGLSSNSVTFTVQ